MNQRIFILGSEWLYMKLYSGPKTIEHIFINEIYPQIMQFINHKVIDYLFFIRYTDPDYHIRLRLHLKNVNDIGTVILFLKELLEDYIVNHVITKMSFDTYNREIERYDNEYIIDVEKVFYYDSLFILNYLTQCNENDGERWLVCLKYIDSILNKCGFSSEDKIEFCETIRSFYAKEIYSDVAFVNKQLSEKFKNNRKHIDSIIENENIQQYDWIPSLTNYLNQITFFTERIKSKKSENKSSEKFSILSSIIHMHVNRMFRTKQRVNECVIYHQLLRYLKSKSVIEKSKTNT